MKTFSGTPEEARIYQLPRATSFFSTPSCWSDCWPLIRKCKSSCLQAGCANMAAKEQQKNYRPGSAHASSVRLSTQAWMKPLSFRNPGACKFGLTSFAENRAIGSPSMTTFSTGRRGASTNTFARTNAKASAPPRSLSNFSKSWNECARVALKPEFAREPSD